MVKHTVEQRALNKIRTNAKELAKALAEFQKRKMNDALAKHNTRMLPNGEPVTDENLEKYSKQHCSAGMEAMSNALASVPASYLAEKRSVLQNINYAYSNTLDRCPRATSQSNSGRCWMFATLNAMRYYLIKDLNLNDHFELSEAFLFFYDKIERANYFLEKMLELRERPLTDHIVHSLLNYDLPVNDGGTFGFFKNLIKKYGIVPKSCYGENFNTQSTGEMNSILWDKLAGYAHEIRSSKALPDTIRVRIRDKMMPEIYSLVVRFLGEPPSEFTWYYHEAGNNIDSNRDRGTYHCEQDLTPVLFYNKYIEPNYNVSNKIMLRHDPRQSIMPYMVYTSEHHGHMVASDPDLAFTVPLDVLKLLTAKSIVNDQPVWFSCDVCKDFNYEKSLLSTEAYDYNKLFNMDFTMSKETMLNMGTSGPVHAMLIVGVDIDSSDETNEKYIKWRVENSWGETESDPDPGYLQMSDGWFDKYVYEVVIDKGIIPDNILEQYYKHEFSPILLDYNDPLGSRQTKTPCA